MRLEYHEFSGLHKIQIGVIVSEEAKTMSENLNQILFGLFTIISITAVVVFICSRVVSAFRRRGNGYMTRQMTTRPHNRGRLTKGF